MINLFYEESYWMGTNRMTGPRAVVRNLLDSLEDQKIPYAVNEEKYDHNFIVQYDRNGYIKHSNLTLENCVIGPQIWFFDEHVKELQQHPERYKSIIVPSQWTKDLAINKFGFERVETWPVGIPLPEIKRDDDVHQFDCMIYSKRRSVQELNAVVDLLQKKKMSFRTLVYGNYNQEELALMCSRAKFCFLLNGTESQGIAVQEIMSHNVPIFSWDVSEWNDMGPSYSIPATSIPYWSDECGEVFRSSDPPLDHILMEETFDRFCSKIDTYNPRKYVEENLSYEQSVKRLLEILC